MIFTPFLNLCQCSMLRPLANVLFREYLGLSMGGSFLTRVCTFSIPLVAFTGSLRLVRSMGNVYVLLAWTLTICCCFQLPEGLKINGLNVYMSKTSPLIVYEMYRMQFEKDFSVYLESRSKELINGGHVVLSIAGRSDVNPTCNDSSWLWELFPKSLVDMAKEVYGSLK